MKIQVNKEHVVLFQVTCFIGDEGGMTVRRFGEETDTLQKAISILEIARIAEKEDWIIVADVMTAIK